MKKAFARELVIYSILAVTAVSTAFLRVSLERISPEELEEITAKMGEVIVNQICSPVFEGYRRGTKRTDPFRVSKNLRFLSAKKIYTYDEIREIFDDVDFSAVDKALARAGLSRIERFDISVKYFNHFFTIDRSEAMFTFVANIDIKTKPKIKGFDKKRTALPAKNHFANLGKKIEVYFGDIFWNKNRFSVDIFVANIGWNRADGGAEGCLSDGETEKPGI
jgi:hypothetical protein